MAEVVPSNEKHEIDQELAIPCSIESYEADLDAERRILRKVDVRLLPILGLLYAICLIDRANISVARISGIDEDLGLDIGDRASVVLLVFFVGYIIFEIPSNIVIKKIGPANWITFIVFAWGLISVGIGLVNSWTSLLVLRIVLGSLEAGFYPGCVYLISCWYLRFEVQKRLAGFYLTAQALSSFANILAYGIIQIANFTAYKGWRWIYIVEGSVTSLVGLLSWFIIVDFPDSKRNKFLTSEEKLIVKNRLRDGQRTNSPKITWAIIWKIIQAWHVWAYSFIYMTGAIGSYAFTFFLPIILQDDLGFSQELAFILLAPPVLFAVLEVILISWLADRYHMRSPFLVFQGVVAIIGLVMVGFLEAPGARYVGTFLGQAGVNGLVPTALAWQANNTPGDAEKSVASAILIMASGVGGIYSSLVFRQQDAPRYIPGIVAVLAVCVVSIVTAIVAALFLMRANRTADRNGDTLEGRKGFRYTV